MLLARKLVPSMGAAALALLSLTAARPASAQNLVVNPGFEANTGNIPTGWFNFFGFVPAVAHDARSGSNAADFDAASPVKVLDQGGAYPGTTFIPTVVGQTYTLSWFVKGAGTNGPFGYGVFNATIGPVGSGSGTSTVISSDSYTEYTLPYVAVSTQTEINFNAFFFGTGNHLYLDDVSLVGPASVVPEPTTLALLGLGLVPAGLLARRRRA